ncbi:hypothetical protein G6F64_001459 [Rhizopus arrhizus]|uniref:Peptidase S59 domain-containing protein n=1 Tax=Rhizopus oryzae TaxID=64495 RepID=A0A9P6XID3_RHIOR|nr:hypothetical protein G6F64_001459 [Rhizopus arrhizus]
MFGKSTFGQPATGGFGQQPQQTNSVFGQQPQQQQPSAFGGFGAANPTGAFGATNTGGAFGQPAQPSAFGQPAATTGFGATTSAFGQPKPTGFGFGNTSTPAFGSTQPAANTGFGGFGSTSATNTSAFGANTANTSGGLFGQRPATGGFGSTTTTGAFGQPQQQQPSAFGGGFGSTTGSAFGQPAAGANQGTAGADFAPTQDRDLTTGVNNFFQTITAMPQYKDYSLEELRLQDYTQGRKTASAAGGAFGQPAAGGAFGQTTNTMGGGAFGQPAATGGAFGQPATGGAFGQPAQGGMFNASNPSGSIFGQQQSSTPAFGQNTGTSAFGQNTGTNAFGSTANTGTTGFGAGATGGAFGANAAKPFGFGSTSAAPTTGFGATGTNAFGQQQTNTGGFGQQPAQTGGFGGFGAKPAGAATNTGFGGFGNTGAATGGFGAATSKPASNFSFGQPATSTGTTGFGGFGATNTATGGFGQPAAGAAGGGLFGANKPATSTTSLFGNTAGGTTGTTGFGGFGTGQTNTTTGFGAGTSGLFGQKPATSTAGGLFGGGTLGGGTTGFGGFGQQQQNTGSFNLPAQGGLTSFGTSGLQTQQQPLIAAVDKNPYGSNPLFDLSKTSGPSADSKSAPSAVAVNGSGSKPATPHYPISPRVVSKIKLRGFSVTPVSRPTKKKTGQSSLEGISDDAVLGVGAFAPRENGKKLVLDDNIDPANIVAIVNKKAEKKEVLFDPSLEYVASKEINSTSAPLPPTQTNSIHPGSGPGLINSIPSSSAAIKNGYYISPTLETLKGMSKESLKTVHNLVIGRKGFGEVKFEKPVDLSEVDLDDLLGNLVLIEDKRVVVYPDETEKKPAGTQLNVPALIKIENCFSHDKNTGAAIRDPQHPRFKLFVDKLRQRTNVEFVDYDDSTGTWTFRTEQF